MVHGFNGFTRIEAKKMGFAQQVVAQIADPSGQN
jgi:hypothetical protein